jgi:hypothetical protein
MNKFHDPEYANHKLIAGKIQDILERIRRVTPLEQADAWIRDKCYSDENIKTERPSGDEEANRCGLAHLRLTQGRLNSLDRNTV